MLAVMHAKRFKIINSMDSFCTWDIQIKEALSLVTISVASKYDTDIMIPYIHKTGLTSFLKVSLLVTNTLCKSALTHQKWDLSSWSYEVLNT